MRKYIIKHVNYLKVFQLISDVHTCTLSPAIKREQRRSHSSLSHIKQGHNMINESQVQIEEGNLIRAIDQTDGYCCPPINKDSQASLGNESIHMDYGAE